MSEEELEEFREIYALKGVSLKHSSRSFTNITSTTGSHAASRRGPVNKQR
jgi:hypothetical protein